MNFCWWSEDVPLQFWSSTEGATLALVAWWLLCKVEHLMIAQINKDCMLLHSQFLHRPVEKHQPSKYQQNLVLLDILCFSGNPICWLVCYRTSKILNTYFFTFWSMMYVSRYLTCLNFLNFVCIPCVCMHLYRDINGSLSYKMPQYFIENILHYFFKYFLKYILQK